MTDSSRPKDTFFFVIIFCKSLFQLTDFFAGREMVSARVSIFHPNKVNFSDNQLSLSSFPKDRQSSHKIGSAISYGLQMVCIANNRA